MAYEKNSWQNDIPGVQEGTPIDADNMNKIEKGIQQAHKLGDVQTVGGTGTAITISDFGLDAYYTGLKVTFIAGANNGGAATTINIDGKGAKNIYKPNTTNAPNFVAGKAYTIYYTGTSFFWQASAEGDAVVANVLAGKTFSNDADTGLVGTMVDRAGDTAALSQTRSGTTIKLRASEGYRDGTNDYVTHTDANDVASNIKRDVTIRGLTGTLGSFAEIVTPAFVNSNEAIIHVDNTYIYTVQGLAPTTMRAYNKDTGAIVWTNASITNNTTDRVVVSDSTHVYLFDPTTITKLVKSTGAAAGTLTITSNLSPSQFSHNATHIYVLNKDSVSGMYAVSKSTMAVVANVSNNTITQSCADDSNVMFISTAGTILKYSTTLTGLVTGSVGFWCQSTRKPTCDGTHIYIMATSTDSKLKKVQKSDLTLLATATHSWIFEKLGFDGTYLYGLNSTMGTTSPSCIRMNKSDLAENAFAYTGYLSQYGQEPGFFTNKTRIKN